MLEASAKDVTFTYRGSSAPSLTNISITAKPGQVTLLCGGSGSGKTTVLRLFNGLVPHFHAGELEGSVRIESQSVPHSNFSALATSCATVFQNPRTQFYTTEVKQELAFGSENLGIEPQIIIDRINHVATKLSITPLLPRLVWQLSGGQMQRVACAAALCNDTPVIIFDEPTANLSADAIDDLANLIAALKADGHTVIIAEHRVNFISGLVDDVYCFKAGKIVAHKCGNDFYNMTDAERKELGLRSLTPVLIDQQLHVPSQPKSKGLHIEGLRFEYQRNKPVLDIADLCFPTGKVTALTGTNGAGKTTLARIICGLEKAKTGSIKLNGKRFSPKDAYIIMQDPTRQLFSDTVRDEVTLGMSKEAKEKVNVKALLEQLDLAEHQSNHPQSLSGGQRQRLVIATALAAHKLVYIFDEPTSGVGYNHLISISQVMRQLADNGAVVIVITHDAELINEAADSVVKLDPLPYDGSTPKPRLLDRFR
ncbi:ABC transporter ATP-binding protein [Arcanobacterium ihumii]|uniref:ABC transporter ATP-binding protein n=1 Tax=Arcanobacterium ihumii TaxID=2138162 RepID=UPI000F52C523|nr:ABC transporter ATP-binding protein [Arcanobacterium ihumii]